MNKLTGFVFYDGPSMLDDAPIVVHGAMARHFQPAV